jgi:site-specific DNA-methyltransferase (adenine-specific)
MLDTNNFSTLRQYFKDLQEWMGKNKKQIIEKIGQKADHCFRWGSSQWDLPTEETYQELIDVFGIDKWEGFRPYESLRQEYESLRYTFNGKDGTKNVMTYRFRKDKRLNHPTQKPVDLIENIIRHSSNEGDTVLDCFLGSGTTGVACKNLNRNFIGIEIDTEYFKIAEKRINETNNLFSH